MTRYQITHTTTTEPADEGAPWGFRRLHLLANGEEIAFHDFPCTNVPAKEWNWAFHGLCNRLYHNPLFKEYRDALYPLAYPYGE